ncbi:AraC family transcriptional regulator [Cohnella fermenti]|nr:helix-turn-helix domain-containing protein [Cohnella fermenti]
MSKTFLKIVGLITLLLVVVQAGFSVTAFKSFEGIVRDRTFEENSKELRIISKSIERMHEDVKAFTFRHLNDPSLIPLFEENSLDYAQMYELMIAIKKSFEVNPIFHSVTLYSGKTDKYYSTLSSQAHKDAFFVNAVKNFSSTPVLTPIPRVLPFEAYNNGDTVFTYLYFQTDSGNRVTQALGVNVDATWLCDTLSSLTGKSVKSYIIDKTSLTYIDDSRQIRSMEALNPELVERITKSNLDTGSFEAGEKGKERIFTYLWMPDTNWVLVVEESNQFLDQSLQIVKKVVLHITFFMALLAFVAAAFISHRIYHPFGRLFREVLGPRGKKEVGVQLLDDVKLLTDVFQKNRRLLHDYNSYKHSADAILLENYIKAVLMENNSIANQLTGEFASVFGNMLDRDMLLILLKIDDRNQFEKQDVDRKKAYRFIMMNVSEEVLDVGNSAKAVYIGEGQFILLIFLPLENNRIEWEEKIRFLQQSVKQFTSYSLSAFIGGHVKGEAALVQAYRTAAILIRYSLVYSREAILEPSILYKHENHQVVYDESLEERFLNAVRAGNGDEAKVLFDKLIEGASQGDIEGFMLLMTRFSLALGNTIDVLNKSRIEKIPVSMKDFYIRLAAFETIDELKIQFYEVIEKMTSHRALVETRHDALVESVKGYIAEHHAEELSLKGLAVEFKLSQGYLGQIFKEAVGLSVLDYINQIRLNKSAELLLQTELSIGEIMERVGFHNESSFYKLFKRKFGATPKGYRVDKEIINKLKEMT